MANLWIVWWVGIQYPIFGIRYSVGDIHTQTHLIEVMMGQSLKYPQMDK